MKPAFTMIELVFVIVILGILAAVAVPKLAATRDDAKASALAANTQICINDIIASYKGLGTAPAVNSFTSCNSAIDEGATVSISGDFVSVANAGVDSLNGNHRMKGTAISY